MMATRSAVVPLKYPHNSSAECYTVLSPFLGHIKCDIPLDLESNVLSDSVVRC